MIYSFRILAMMSMKSSNILNPHRINVLNCTEKMHQRNIDGICFIYNSYGVSSGPETYVALFTVPLNYRHKLTQFRFKMKTKLVVNVLATEVRNQFFFSLCRLCRICFRVNLINSVFLYYFVCIVLLWNFRRKIYNGYNGQFEFVCEDYLLSNSNSR